MRSRRVNQVEARLGGEWRDEQLGNLAIGVLMDPHYLGHHTRNGEALASPPQGG